MRWYEKLYVGEKARDRRFSIIQSIRHGKASGYYVLTPPSNSGNLLDMYPAYTLTQPYYQKQDLLIIGVAADFEDAAELAGRILQDLYRKTGGFDLSALTEGNLFRE